jgi:hypothetical protein
MKTKIALLALLSTFSLQPSTLLAQGSLTPPGAPAQTMKSLDQVYARLDSRTAITNAASGFFITAPGSYYLTTNLTVSSGNGININASGVTLDLNGFTISSTNTPPSFAGISLNGAFSDITIVNGHIRSSVTNNGSGVYGGSGFASGIACSVGVPPTNVMVSMISVSGVKYYGIYLCTGNATIVEACTVTTAGDLGIFASTIKDSVATDSFNAIIGDQVADCRGIGSGNGVVASTTVQNCYGQSSGVFAGVSVSGTALNCFGTNSSSGAGIFATIAQNCIGSSVSGIGLQATIANSCLVGRGTTNVTYKYNMP